MDTEPDEYQLALRAREGNLDALGELVERTRLRLFALAYAELRHYEDAQDAVASALLQICLHINALKQPERVRAWMQSIVRNECRRLRRSPPALSLEDLELEAPESSCPVLRLDIERALRRLPGRHPDALHLFYLEDIPLRDIARHTGRPEGTIKYWLHQGRQLLATEMEDYMPVKTTGLQAQQTNSAERGPGEPALLVHTGLKPRMVQRLFDSLRVAGYAPVETTPAEVSDCLSPALLESTDTGAGIIESWWNRYTLILVDEWIAGRSAFELLVNARALLDGEITLPRTPEVCLLSSDPPASTVYASWYLGVDRLVNKKRPEEISRLGEISRRSTARHGLAGPQHLWSRFTQHSQAAVIAAQAEAARNGSREVTPEHLLMGILESADRDAREIIHAHNGDPEDLHSELRAGSSHADLPPIPVEEVSLAIRCKRVVDTAFAEAWQNNAAAISPHYLMYGILLEAGPAGHKLRALGVDPVALREQIRRREFEEWSSGK